MKADHNKETRDVGCLGEGGLSKWVLLMSRKGKRALKLGIIL